MAQTVLITGSSTGIGKATAKLFHDNAWNVVATMRTPEDETELTELDNVLVTRLAQTATRSRQSRSTRRRSVRSSLLSCSTRTTPSKVEATN